VYPNITDGIVLTGFSINPTFAPLFVAGNNFQLANLNQPLRFGNVTGRDVQSLLTTYAPGIADYLSPLDFGAVAPAQNLPNGYLVNSDAAANKYLFLYGHHYDPNILTYAEATKQPVTVGEVLSLGGAATSEFAGPVMVINGGLFALSDSKSWDSTDWTRRGSPILRRGLPSHWRRRALHRSDGETNLSKCL
jgi:hypothetical protein